MKLFNLLIITFLNISFFAECRSEILLFTCNYGSGHKMATQGIIESLPDYNIRAVDIYGDPLRSLVPKLNEQLYNDMAKNECYRAMNFISKIAPHTLLWQRKNIEELLRAYISKQKPDMIISCIPLVNSMLLNVAKKFDIPLLVVATDIDISAFCFGFDSAEEGKKFQITIPYNDKSCNEKFPLLKNVFHYNFGYPTRRAFSEEIDESAREKIRAEYGIQKDENLILVMMGGNSAKASEIYAELLLSMNDKELDQITKNKIHLLCLCGDISLKENFSLMQKLNNKKPHPRIRIHGCPGTTKIAELASLPELRTVISKPGGSTVNEMIKKRVPMVYHVNDTPLYWEKGNMEYGEERNYGVRFLVPRKVDQKAKRAFADVLTRSFALYHQMRANPVPESEIDFGSNLRMTVKEMLYN